MKCKTKLQNGEVFFSYGDSSGNMFGTWHDLAHNGHGCGYLVGYFRSYYCGCVEPIDDLFLIGKPMIGEVKEFIRHCFEVIA